MQAFPVWAPSFLCFRRLSQAILSKKPKSMITLKPTMIRSAPAVDPKIYQTIACEYLRLLCLILLIGLGLQSTASAFTHPGLLHTQADLDRMSAKVAANQQPWKGSWDRLVANSHAQLSYTPNPVVTLIRGTTTAGSENYSRAMNDAAAAYQTALRWKITGDTAYADKSIQILNAWANTCTSITGDTNQSLAAGLYGYQFANAAEIMRTYGGWTPADFTNFKNWMVMVFYAKNHDFLIRHHGTCSSHYWSNWDLCNMASMMAIGVLCDDQAIYDEAVDYFYNGIGNGNINRLVYHIHAGFLGQAQESGRDQGHATLSIALAGVICEQAWNQGVDFYSYDNNRILAAAEYVAKYNLYSGVPFTTYMTCEGEVHTVVSSTAQGNQRVGWESIYQHYANRKGLAAPYTGDMAAKLRPDGGGGDYGGTSGGFDHLGFGGLVASLDAIPAGAAPSGLKADVTGRQVTLSWWGSTYATSYNIKRSIVSGGPYVTLATVAGNRSGNYHIDSGLSLGSTYYYVVSANNSGGEGPNSTEISAAPNDKLSGALIGSAGSFGSKGAGIATVFDNELQNFYDAANTSGDWAGQDLGYGVSAVVTQVRYCPRENFQSRMVGGKFQGSNTPGFSSGVVDLFTITAQPTPGVLTTQTISNGTAFRYLRYLGPANGSCNVAEVEFYGTASGIVPPEAPVGLSSVISLERVGLSWTATAGATNYRVKRSTAAGGPYVILGNTTGTSFSDTPGLTNGVTWFYVLSAMNSAGESVDSAPISITPTSLRAHLTFDETSGTTANDASGNGRTGTLVNGGLWASGKSGGALDLDGTDDHVSFATGVASSMNDFTLSLWVKPDVISTWSRIVDFGSGTGTYMFLTPRNGASGVVRFAIKSGGSEQVINGTSALSAGVWTHIAVTKNGSTGTLYINGTLVGSNPAMTHTPSSLGATTQNWLGRSQFSADPYFDGSIDEFRLYNEALGSSQIFDIANPSAPSAPIGLSASVVSTTQINLSWNASAGATGYNLKRSSISGGPYTTVSNQAGTTYSDTELSSGTNYYYVVTAENSVGEGTASSEISALTVPASPGDVVVTAGNGEATITWSASTGASSYTVERASSSGGPFTIVASGVTSLSYLDTGLSSGSTYYYRVSAGNASGTSGTSTVGSSITLPAAPVGLIATAGNTTASLTWNASTGADSYSVLRSLTSGGGYSVIASGLTSTSFGDSGLSNGTTYFYTVIASNVSGASTSSTEASATPIGLPSPWSTLDVGAVAAPGVSNHNAGVYTIEGSGADIGGSADEFRYAYQNASGDCDIIARVAAIENTASLAKAGIVIRESSATGSRYAGVFLTPGGQALFQRRSTTNGSTTTNTATSITTPRYIRLTRTGSTFRAYHSTNGTSWSQFGGNRSVTLPTSVSIGLGVSSHADGTLCTGTFSNVTVTP
jgi:fibronectin type 3 domain-containing protein